MELKRYQANSMAEALEQVKMDLGNDAVILHTRTIRKGGVMGVGSKSIVEITASGDITVLHPAERRAIIGREGGRPRRGRSQGDNGGRRKSSSPAEGAAMRSATRPTAEPPPQQDISAFTSAVRGEMDELRSMVKELLNRPVAAGAGPKVPEMPEELRGFYTNLIQNAVAEEIAGEIVTTAKKRMSKGRKKGKQKELGQLVPEVLIESIEKMLPVAEPIQLRTDGNTKYVALVGPTGVGKTTTIAKLAAHFKLREGKRVGLVTIDTYRIAAVDQLKAYAEILNVPLQIVFTPEEMSEALGRMSDLDLVLIDTSGRSQKDSNRLNDLKLFLDAAREFGMNPVNAEQNSATDGASDDTISPLEIHLVLSCTSHPGQLSEVVDRFGVLSPDRVVFTKLDEAVGLGVVLNVIHRLKLQLSYLTTGQEVPDDIEVGHRRRIAEMVLDRKAQVFPGGSSSAKSSASVDHVV